MTSDTIKSLSKGTGLSATIWITTETFTVLLEHRPLSTIRWYFSEKFFDYIFNKQKSDGSLISKVSLFKCLSTPRSLADHFKKILKFLKINETTYPPHKIFWCKKISCKSFEMFTSFAMRSCAISTIFWRLKWFDFNNHYMTVRFICRIRKVGPSGAVAPTIFNLKLLFKTYY